MKKILTGVVLALIVTTTFITNVSAAQRFPGEACTPGTDTCDGGGVTNYTCNPATNRCDPAAFNNSLIYTPRSALEGHVRGTIGTDGKQKSVGSLQAMVDGFGDQGAAAIGGDALNGQAGIMNMISAMYISKPASVPQYVEYVKRNIGIPGVENAYAQGYGYQSLLPIQDLWKLTRNIALAAFVVVFIIIGFMIMLRSKIDPRTVITVQQAVPKLVVSLVLVVFSFAICGLAIDFTTLLTRVGASVLQSEGFIGMGCAMPCGERDPARLDKLLSTSIFGLFGELYNTQKIYEGFTDLPADFLSPINVILKVDALVGQSGLTRTVVVIAIFIAVIRTFFVLLEAYLKVTLTVIVSPLQMLVLAIPGQGKGFGDWFRGLMANLLIFPVVFFMLAFAAILYAASDNGVAPTNISDGASSTAYYSRSEMWGVGRFIFKDGTYWAPPALGDWKSLSGPLLALGIILTLPKVAASVKEAVHPAGKAGAADGEASKSLQSAAQRIPVVGSMLR